VNKLGLIGSILAFLAAFLRAIPVVLLPGGNAPTDSSNLFSMAMFSVGSLEVFPWGTVDGQTVTLLADFTASGVLDLGVWGMIIIAIVLGCSGSTPHATPQHAKIQLTLASFFMFAEAGIFLFLSILFSPLGVTGVRLGWSITLGSGVVFAFAAGKVTSPAKPA